MSTVSLALCRACGCESDGQYPCPHCHVPVDIATSLPEFPHLEVTDAPSVNRWNAAQLKTHPGAPWDLHLPAGEAKIITAKEINYNDVLDATTSLFLWCPPDMQTLYVRDLLPEQCEDRWLAIRGKVCRCGVLHPGDLLTIGSYPWVFHAYSQGQGFGLEPANPIAGARVQLQDVAVGNRLNIPELRLDSGTSVGIIGETGTGKSTLIREIAETRVGSGKVLIGGHSRDQSPDPAAQCVAYVPQMDLLYDDMTVIQQTVDYVQLVKPKVKLSDIDESLRVVGLLKLKDRLPSQLSGGQVRRMRLAAALARRPGVLVLDEPDSGLDPETALSVRRLLRTISLLGTTTVTVTHHRHGMELFDRVLTIHDGQIISDLQPAESSRDYEDASKVDAQTAMRTTATRWNQFKQVLKRECVQFKQRTFFATEQPIAISLPQWLLVVVLIPGLFGLGIGLAAPIGKFQPHLVGFLCVLSVIWMSASYSHLALTTSWARVQYERCQGLRAYPFIAAKSVFLGVVTTFQTCVFFLVLWATRHLYLEQPMFYGRARDAESSETAKLGQQFFVELDDHALGVLATLVVVGFASSQVGLVISVLAQWRTLVAASILPLVMIVQILFSPFVVSASKSDDTLEQAYAGFWWQQNCEGIPTCPSRLLFYRSDDGFICQDCTSTLRSSTSMIKTSSPVLTEKQLKERLDSNDNVPIFAASAASYLTLTRYADLALRPIISKAEGESHEQTYGYASLRRSGLMCLIGIAVVSHGLVALLFGCLSPRSILRRFQHHPLTKGS